MASLAKLFDPNEREIKRHLAVAAAITSLEPELEALDDAGLRARSDELRQRAQEGEDLNELLIEAFALCREASRRTTGLRHFDVQLLGGAVVDVGGEPGPFGLRRRHDEVPLERRARRESGQRPDGVAAG